MNALHKPLVQRFRDDLAAVPVSDVIRKHITTGEPVGLSSETYFSLRKRVAEQFAVHPSAVVLVGSCRLGFSLKHKGGKRYRPMSRSADVDVAVVSDRLFDAYWNQVFEAVQDDRHWALNQGKGFVRDLFSGWLSPHLLPNSPRFSDSREWAEFFARLTIERLCGYRTVSARLYRTWDRLEAYQKIMVETCRAELMGIR
jgi:hypothetical protein